MYTVVWKYWAGCRTCTCTLLSCSPYTLYTVQFQYTRHSLCRFIRQCPVWIVVITCTSSYPTHLSNPNCMWFTVNLDWLVYSSGFGIQDSGFGILDRVRDSWFRIQDRVQNSWFRIQERVQDSWFRIQDRVQESWFRILDRVQNSGFRKGFRLCFVWEPAAWVKCKLSHKDWCLFVCLSRSEMRRWSLVSQSSGYTTCTTDSPTSLSVS